MTSPEQRAKNFAEQELGVQTVYHDATAAMAAYDDATQERLDVARNLRSVKESIEDRELEVIEQTTADNPDMAATPLKAEIKTAIATDERLRALRHDLAMVQGQLDDADANIERNKYKMRIYAARMEELAGLLNFYAAVKTTRMDDDA